ATQRKNIDIARLRPEHLIQRRARRRLARGWTLFAPRTLLARRSLLAMRPLVPRPALSPAGPLERPGRQLAVPRGRLRSMPTRLVPGFSNYFRLRFFDSLDLRLFRLWRLRRGRNLQAERSGNSRPVAGRLG